MTRFSMIRNSLTFISLAAFTAAVSCSPTATGPGDGDGGDGDGDGDINPGDGDINPGDGDINPGDGDGDGDGDMREAQCTIDPITQMEVCVCITVATWGGLGTFGAVPGMDGQDAIGAWLAANSTNDAAYFPTKPAITADMLAEFDVIILQDLSAWAAFTADEIATFNAWLNAGGGVISLNGYSANGAEMTNVNALLASTGMSYVPNSDTFGNPAADACGYCYGSSIPQAGWTTHPIAANLTFVGAFHGRAITPGDAEVVAQTAEGVLGAAKQMGDGRAFMFHDEWVTYNSQWTGQNLPSDCRYGDPNNACNDKHPLNDYRNSTFWYNALKWASGDPACFVITDPTVIR
jgi:hypothetical protein